MAWVDVTGSNSVWQYENAATASNTYPDAPGVYSGGIRTYTTPGTGQVNEIYARTRKKGQQNYFLYSEQLDTWTTVGGSVTKNVITAPDGSLTGNKFISTSTSGTYTAQHPANVIATQPYIVSCYAKAGDADNFRITNISSPNTGGWFDLTNGTIGTQNDTAADGNVSTMVSVGDGWYRCARSFPITETHGTNTFLFGVNEGNALTSAPGGGAFLYVWGAYVGDGIIKTDYRKTEAAISPIVERGELSKDYLEATHVGY